ncbi:hypothetical protein Pelo_3271 [Pelomyxa schiedti]|nr:hypothetical protein Pelo_3271 [Pelomyxa schiedti]
MNETVSNLSFIQRYVFPNLFGNDYQISTVQVPPPPPTTTTTTTTTTTGGGSGPCAFCNCKRKRGSNRWRTDIVIGHLKHFDKPETEFVVRMAEVYHPWGRKKARKWLKNRVGSITNRINVCAACGTPRLATEYLTKFQNRFHCFPGSTPGAFEYALAHAQYRFAEEWAKFVMPGAIPLQLPQAIICSDENNSSSSNSTGNGVVVPRATGSTVMISILSREWKPNNRNLCVAVCMGISTAIQQCMMAVRRGDDKGTLGCYGALMRDLVEFLVFRTPMDDKIKAKDLLEVASATGAVPVVEAILQKAPPSTQILYNEETRRLCTNAFCHAVSGGHPELCKVFLNAVPNREGLRHNRKNFSTILLRAACTTTENFIATKKVVQELFESEPSRWGTEPDPPEFVRQGWPQFGKSMVLKAASLSAMWGIVKILVSADFSQGDEEVQRTLPTILGYVARHHTDEATDMFDEILLLCQRLPWSTDRLRVWLEETLKLVCESKNVAIFRSLVNHPDFKAVINATLLSDLLVKALTPPPEHFHRAYEDFIGLPNSALSSISVQQHYLVPTRNKPPETPLGVADALLPFLRDQIRTGKFKMNAAVRYLIQKGCSRDALEWLSFNDLFSKDVVQYPILLFEGILRLRPESTKKGGTVHCPIGYKKLNKHIFTLQAVLTALAQMFHVRDMILALYKVQDSTWPVTLYLLSTINDKLGGAVAEYVGNKITVKMLYEAVFVDLSVSGKFFSMDGTRDLPSLFDWLVMSCSSETIARVLREFLPHAGEELLSKHPNQGGVEAFHRKVHHYKGVPQREEGSPSAMGNGRADYLIPQNQWPLNQSPSPASMMATPSPAPVKKQSRDRNLLRKRKNQSLVPEAVRPESLPPSSIGLHHHYGGPHGNEKSTTTATASNTNHVHSSARVVEGPNTFLVPPLPFFIQQPQPAATTSTIATNQRDRSDDPMKYVTEGTPAQVLETNTDSSNDTNAAAPTGPHPKSPGHTQPPPTQR